MANYKASQYIPSFLKAAYAGDSKSYTMNFADAQKSNIENEDSFAYDTYGTGVKSTQQINLDWSKFENHTFFMSAEAKVNLAFEQIINSFPFDGSRREVDDFFTNLTGFDKWVFDQFPKYRGQLHFSGSALTETSPDKGTYVLIKDVSGALFPTLSPDASAKESVINPKNGKSMSIEMHLYIPQISTNGTQIILQKLNEDINHGFSIRLNSTISTTSAEVQFDAFAGTSAMTTSLVIQKGVFNHLCFVLDREGGLPLVKIYKDAKLSSVSTAQTNFGDLSIDYADLKLGSGSQYSVFTSIVTPQQTFSGTLDELRIFHEVRSESQQKSYAKKSIFSTPELKLYYRFNEPAPPLSPIPGDLVNSILLDSSGNSLHSYITNFIEENRENAAFDSASLMEYEKSSTCPVLFPANVGVVSLNANLLDSAMQYDLENPNLITKLVPRHYLLEGAASQGLSFAEQNNNSPYGGTGIPGQGVLSNVQLFLSLLYIWARFFDEIRIFADAFSKIKNVQYELEESTPNNFLFDIFKSYGLFLPPFFNGSTVEQYLEGENIDPLIKGNESLSLQNVQHELLRRILINLPSVIKSKGTQHSIKSFLRALGIDPESSMRFREYGGPNYRVLEKSRDQKSDVAAMVRFLPTSYVTSPYLSASRTEVGYPPIAGNFVDQLNYPLHGISDDPNDGLLTSGSWAVETSVKYNLISTQLTSLTQSIVRMCVTGSNRDPGLTANLVVFYEEDAPYVKLFMRPGISANAPHLEMKLDLPQEAIFNGDVWSLTFGCNRNDSFGSLVSSSYYLRVGSQNDGELRYYATTSSYFYELFGSGIADINSYRELNNIFNASGSFLAVGTNQQIAAGTNPAIYRYLNNESSVLDPASRETTFDGRSMKLRFWSKSFTAEEWVEHVKNYQSLGVIRPRKNYNYEKISTGSFERLRLDSLSKQEQKLADINGNITFLDFSENLLHLQGSGFSTTENALVPELIRYSHLSPYFDESLSSEKIRVRGYSSDEYLDQNPWASRAPVYETVRSESPIDDPRFSIDFSLVDTLNKDIINMFATFETLDNMLGKPELLFSPDYPELDVLRNVYFNRLKEKLNFKAFFEFYSWIDNSINIFIEQLLPRKTVYKGTNFIIESHMLERHKLEYRSSQSYLMQGRTNSFTYSND